MILVIKIVGALCAIYFYLGGLTFSVIGNTKGVLTAFLALIILIFIICYLNNISVINLH